MDPGFEREVLLIGQEKVNRLANAKVLLFGVGGVGGYTAECLARAGIGHITLVDSDKVDITNINRIEYAKANNGIYDIRGQKVGTMDDYDRLPAGIYIINGKKSVKK